jgi:hypothetical protein
VEPAPRRDRRPPRHGQTSQEITNGNPLLDPRVPRLVVLVRRYRRCDRVALFAADANWRLSFATDETIAYRPDRNFSMIESTSPLAAGVLELLAGSAGVLADLLPNAERVA